MSRANEENTGAKPDDGPLMEPGTPPPAPAPDAEVAFRWKQARENLLTTSGLRMFQLAYAHKGEEYESARAAIDAEYTRLSPRLAARGGENNRHGGSFINYISLLEELGLMFRVPREGSLYLESTPAGDQIAVVLSRAPDLLKIIPHFLLDILSRYALNNPKNQIKKNSTLRDQIRSSDLFPYWTLYKVMRSLGNRVTEDELRRFVFKLHSSDQVDATIQAIRSYRNDLSRLTAEELDNKYGRRIEGAAGQPKYIMGRAGFQSGLIEQDGDVYTIASGFLPFVEEVLKNPPSYEELDEDTWIATYGRPVDTAPVLIGPDEPPGDQFSEVVSSELKPSDSILEVVRTLLFEDGYGGVLLSGAPGTGKSWYARQIALALTNGETKRIREIQFHPSYQYEDFVEGYSPIAAGDFKMKPKHLLEMCQVARETEQPTFLVIDEFSRCDPVRVMGEALTYMETTLRDKRFHLASGRPVSIPPNLYFLATMNPEDRSVDEMDAAMERRWAKVELRPDASKVNDFLRDNGVDSEQRGPIVEFFQTLQDDTAIGHAFFRRLRDVEGLERLWNSQLIHVVRKQHRYNPDLVDSTINRFERLMFKLRQPVPRAIEGEGGAAADEPVQEANPLRQGSQTGESGAA